VKTFLVSPKAAATVERLRSFKVTPEVASKVQAFEARQNAARSQVDPNDVDLRAALIANGEGAGAEQVVPAARNGEQRPGHINGGQSS